MTWWCAASKEPWSWSFRPYPGIWLFMGLLLAVYLLAFRSAPAGSAETDRRKRWAFVGGWLVLWLSTDWPLGTLGAGYLATAHMAQYVLYTMAALDLGAAFAAPQTVARLTGDAGAGAKEPAQQGAAPPRTVWTACAEQMAQAVTSGSPANGLLKLLGWILTAAAGTLGAGLDAVLGPAWSGARIELFPERHGLLLALLPPGAFILLGLMLAARRRLAHHRELRRSAALALGDSQA